MTKQQTENDLEQARREAVALANHPDYLRFASLVRQFERLDAAEQKEKAAGKLGGRPADKRPSAAAKRKRAQRARAKAAADQAQPVDIRCADCGRDFATATQSFTRRAGDYVCVPCAIDRDAEHGQARRAWCVTCELDFSTSSPATTRRNGDDLCAPCARDYDDAQAAKKSKAKKGGKK